jgi:CDP-glucose 4,6-dehydratase
VDQWAGAVEGVAMTPQFWNGRRVLLTGHTGFKGSWLALWLHELGARVTGLAMPALPESLFLTAKVETALDHRIGDIRDLSVLRSAVRASEPEIIFHLAAQSLVRASYRGPVETFAINVQGTAHVLQASAECDAVKAIVMVTSDKCYENRERIGGYRESEPMGGDDPYSASKGCAELLIHSWRQSFFAGGKVASARAGNVIGGGDWAEDRLVPDLVRAFLAGAPGAIRNPASVRPWQHVLEPLLGYLMLAERLYAHRSFAEGWNFGPDPSSVTSVRAIADRLAELWGDNACWEQTREANPPKEAALLQLDSTKAQNRLQWRPVWSLDRALDLTVAWYKSYAANADMATFTREQIKAYRRCLKASSALAGTGV